MSAPTTPFYPMTHDDAQEMIEAIRQSATPYTYRNAQEIVNAVRSGKTVPLGVVFKEHHAVYGDVYFVTRARNQHKVAGDSTAPTVTIQAYYVISNNGGATPVTFAYDAREAFAKVTTSISSGTVCKFTIAETYGSWAAGTYKFTATNSISEGSMLTFSDNAATALTSLTVDVHSSAKDATVSASYAITSGGTGATVNFGTLGTDCNSVERVASGSNNEAQSNIFQFLNGDSGSGYMADIWQPKTDYDMMDSTYSSLKGFLGGFSSDFRSCIGLCAIPNQTNTVYEDSPYTTSEHYSHPGYFFLPSEKEIYGTSESQLETDETQFPYYAEVGTDNLDKLMFANGATSPSMYWLRTPQQVSSSAVRRCNVPTGQLAAITAANRIAICPLCILA